MGYVKFYSVFAQDHKSVTRDLGWVFLVTVMARGDWEKKKNVDHNYTVAQDGLQ